MRVEDQDQDQARADVAERELARLRAALEAIFRLPLDWPPSMPREAYRAVQIASAALDGRAEAEAEA